MEIIYAKYFYDFLQKKIIETTTFKHLAIYVNESACVGSYTSTSVQWICFDRKFDNNNRHMDKKKKQQ